MIKLGLALAAAVAAFLVLGRDDTAEAVRECIEKAGATVEASPNFAQLFPYAMALGADSRVGSYPELEEATVYGVAYGEGEALLFVGDDESDAEAFERTLTGFAAGGGVTLPSRRAGKVLLIWTVPLASFAAAPLDDCVDG
jgi:hypothetical protein